MKYSFADKEKLLSFGAYPEVTLAAARLRRAEAKARPSIFRSASITASASKALAHSAV